MISRTGAVLAAGLLWTAQAVASPIFYEVESLGGNQWRYAYTVGNETDAPIDWFAIYFDYGLYQFDLVTVEVEPDFFADEVDPAVFSGPAGWDILVAPPDDIFGVEDDGYFDGFSFAPIAPGGLLGGFTIDFYYLGSGTPGSQSFELLGYDEFDAIEVLGTGNTQPLRVAEVPEPGTLGLLAAGLLFGWRRAGASLS